VSESDHVGHDRSGLVVDGVAKSFPTPAGPLPVLRNVSLHLSRGDSVAVVGPSGSGKSTLLQILGTLDRPDAGSVRIDGKDPFELGEQPLARFRNQTIGFIFQDHQLLPHLNVIENVLIPALAIGRPSAEDTARAESLLESVGLVDRRGHRPGELSGGQRERVAIARALVMNPTLILADEPTGNLDRTTAASMTELMLQLQADHEAVLVTVTHSETLAGAMNARKELVDGELVDGKSA